ncbi:ZIP family metal transporter [Candidatus Woesearchaeota archaeon]|nr:MAG: ZIP family metal transporter [Candidatus Woesearchaeota archaeon]
MAVTAEIIYIFVSVLAVSLLAILAAIPFLLKKDVPHSWLMALLSLSVGTLLGGVFLHFLPEAFEQGFHEEEAFILIAGFLVFFIIEKFVHGHHQHKVKGQKHDCGHHHGYHLAPINLIGDGIHNFLDGLVIAGAYLVSVPLGIAATINVALHELPQEFADMGILLFSGFSKKKAIFFNFLSAITAIAGAGVGIVVVGASESIAHMIIPFAAGSFLYIASANLVPELHRHCGFKETVVHIIAILVGVGLMVLLAGAH